MYSELLNKSPFAGILSPGCTLISHQIKSNTHPYQEEATLVDRSKEMRLECGDGPAYLRRVMPVRKQESRLSIYQSRQVYLQEAPSHVRAFFLDQATLPLSLWARFLYNVFRHHILTRAEVLSEPERLLAALSAYRQYVLPFSHPYKYSIVRGQDLATWLQTFAIDPEVGLTEEIKQALESQSARAILKEIKGPSSRSLQHIRAIGLCLLESALEDILRPSEAYVKGLWPEESLLIQAVLNLSGQDKRWIWVVETVGSQEAKHWIAHRLCAPVPAYVFPAGCVQVDGKGMYGRGASGLVYARIASHLGINMREGCEPDVWIQTLKRALSPERPLLLIVVNPVNMTPFEWLQEVPPTYMQTVVVASHQWRGNPDRVWTLQIGPPSESRIRWYWERKWKERGIRHHLTPEEENEVKAIARNVGYNLDEVNRVVEVVNNREQMSIAVKALQDVETRALLLGYKDGRAYWERLVQSAALGWGAPYYDLRDACILLGTQSQALAFAVLQWGVKVGEAYYLGGGRYVIKERVLSAYRARVEQKWGRLAWVAKWWTRLRLMDAVRPYVKEVLTPVNLLEKMATYFAPLLVWVGKWKRIRRGVLEYIVMTEERSFDTAFVVYRGEQVSYCEKVAFYRYKLLVYITTFISMILTVMVAWHPPFVNGWGFTVLHLGLLAGMLHWFALWQRVTWPKGRIEPRILYKNAVPAD